MSIKAIVVFGTALVMSSTLNAQAQKTPPAQRVPFPKPAQAEQGARGAEAKLNKLDLRNWISTPIEGKQIKGAPYSAVIETESVQTLGDGNRIVHRSTARVYRDTDGRVRREEEQGSDVTVTITDPVADKSFALDPAARTARQTALLPLFGLYLENFPLHTGDFWIYRGTTALDYRVTKSTTFELGRGGRGRGGQPGGGRDESAEEALPNRTIEGVVASGLRRTTTIPQGAIGNEQPIRTVTEEWTSVDLKVLVLTETNDPRTGRSTYRLVNIVRADPDPALFKVPADYTLLFGRGRGGR